jgi:uncharacterized membrane protein
MHAGRERRDANETDGDGEAADMTSQPMIESVAPVPGGPNDGPYTITGTEAEPFDWRYRLRPGKTPSREQHALAEAASGLADKLRRFRGEAEARDLALRLRHMVEAVLVQRGDSDEAERYLETVAEMETEFFRGVVTPKHRENLNGPVLISVLAFLVILFATRLGAPALEAVMGSLLPQPVALAGIEPFGYVVAGTLLGRLLYFSISWGEAVTSLEDYALARAQARAVWLSLMFDVIVGIAACAAFVSGLIVIAIGVGQGGGGISTAEIATNGLVAFVFGMIVGLAKTDFLNRLKTVAKERTQ